MGTWLDGFCVYKHSKTRLRQAPRELFPNRRRLRLSLPSLTLVAVIFTTTTSQCARREKENTTQSALPSFRPACGTHDPRERMQREALCNTLLPTLASVGRTKRIRAVYKKKQNHTDFTKFSSKSLICFNKIAFRGRLFLNTYIYCKLKA